MTGRRVLVVDDEPQIHRFLHPVLEAAGFQVERALSGSEALRKIAAASFETILLDLGLPDIDGQDVLLRVRRTLQTPIIVLSARDRPEEKVRALDGGADDYVEKPFDVSELLARIRAALRHALAQEGVAAIVRVSGGLEIDLAAREVRVDGVEIDLTRKEYEVLALLARHPGKLLTHRVLLREVWGPAHEHDVQYLRVYVGQIRRKLGPAAGAALATATGVGYRLI
jgi:two-component system KDP operon response regulator KdpE